MAATFQAMCILASSDQCYQNMFYDFVERKELGTDAATSI